MISAIDDGIVVKEPGMDTQLGEIMQPTRVPAALRERLGEAASAELLEMVETKMDAAVDRFERRLGEEIGALRVEFRTGIADLRAELLKWSFLFWTGQIVTIAALLALTR